MIIKRERVVFFALFIVPIITDLLLSLTGIKAGLYLKFFIYLAFIFIVGYEFFYRHFILSFLAFYPILISILTASSKDILIFNLIESIRLSYIFVIIAYVYKKYEFTDSKLILNNVSVFGGVLSSVIILPFLFGVGSATYFEGAYGNKGFFTAQNPISITLSLCLLVSLYMYAEYKDSKHIVYALFVFSAMIILGTRFAMIMAFFIPICFVLNFNIKMIFLSAIGVFVFSTAIYLFISNMLGFGEYEQEKFSNIVFFDKGRMALLDSAKDYYFSRDYLEVFFGSGNYEYARDIFKKIYWFGFKGNVKTIEMEPLDFFGQYGFVYTFFVYLFLIIPLYQMFKKSNMLINRVIFISLLIFFMHSIVAAHAFVNHFSAPIIAVLYIISQQSFFVNRSRINEK